ncbi:MAG: hypothetical protein WEA81_02480, partial [Dehalococcoidia bacterium]
MTDTGSDQERSEESAGTGAPRSLSRPTPEELSAAATRVGGILGRFARRARAIGGQAAAEARPEAERLARQARA